MNECRFISAMGCDSGGGQHWNRRMPPNLKVLKVNRDRTVLGASLKSSDNYWPEPDSVSVP